MRRRIFMLGAACAMFVFVYNFVHNQTSITNVIRKHNMIHPTTLVSVKPQSRHAETQPYTTANCARTKPPFYPFNGTGTTVNVGADFDFARFKDFCEVEDDLTAVVPVYSAPGNFERRKAMRETIGKLCVQLKCKMFFIVGVSLDKAIYAKVKEEYLTVKDMLVINKVDTYRDLNNKAVAMLDWLLEFCRAPQYVIHIIDDFFPNLPEVIEQLRSTQRDRFILGYTGINLNPNRGQSSKWYLSYQEYPYAKYPPYIKGVMYAFRNNNTAILRQKAHAAEYCWVEDVWFTGFVRLEAGFKFLRMRKGYQNRFDSSYNLSYFWRDLSGMHRINETHFYLIYERATLYNHTGHT